MAKKKAPRRTYAVPLTGELAGFELTMGAMSGRELIMLRRGDATEADVLEMVASHCLAHNFDVDDIRDLDAWMFESILLAWGEAQQAAALPQTNGGQSSSD